MVLRAADAIILDFRLVRKSGRGVVVQMANETNSWNRGPGHAPYAQVLFTRSMSKPDALRWRDLQRAMAQIGRAREQQKQRRFTQVRMAKRMGESGIRNQAFSVMASGLARTSFFGSITKNLLPIPERLSTFKEPKWASAIQRPIDSPMPAPPDSRDRVLSAR